MDDLFIKVLARLVSVYENLGRRVFEDAAHRALIGIGAAAGEEAKRQAGTPHHEQDTNVVKFPLDRAAVLKTPQDSE
jgi:hypothetical protein